MASSSLSLLPNQGTGKRLLPESVCEQLRLPLAFVQASFRRIVFVGLLLQTSGSRVGSPVAGPQNRISSSTRLRTQAGQGSAGTPACSIENLRSTRERQRKDRRITFVGEILRYFSSTLLNSESPHTGCGLELGGARQRSARGWGGGGHARPAQSFARRPC